MVNDSRRSFIKKSAVVGAGAAAISTTPNVFASIEKALSIPANRKHGSIKDVEHVVILMQENRSFVRGAIKTVLLRASKRAPIGNIYILYARL